jgi:hypothetical protein
MNSFSVVKNIGFILLLLSANCLFAESHKILITEFMAINSKTLADEDGDFSDWIEIYNPGETSINLEGWFLTDKADNLSKWKFPAVSIKADGYLVVFASEKKRRDPNQNLHTNFKLSGSGEFLAIVEPDGTTISHTFGDNFPAQREDISYGVFLQQNIYFDQPTPGAANQHGESPLPPIFSLTRNFYTAPFDVSLTKVGEGEIYYTTNGTRPTMETGIKYQHPIHIQTTTPLSAVTIKADGSSSETITQTYFFTDSIVNQTNNPPGYPSEWSPLRFSSGNAPADYEMDPEVCNNPEYKDLMDDALKSIPTLSIVTNPGYLFSHEKNSETGGIYIYTGNTKDGSTGKDWERPVSVEYFDPNSNKEFQVNCGILLHGGNSRIPDNSQKHSFRLSFRSLYGPSKLNFNLFDDNTATNEFNAIVLRAGYNYSWTKNDATQRKNAQYLQDSFAKNTQLDLGHPSAHERFVHLYLNGIYWGLYNISEKLTNDFMDSYLKGKEDDFDVIKDHGGVVDGYWTAWTKLYNQAKSGLSSNTNYQKVQGKNPDGTVNTSYDNLLDIENLIDYIQYNIYIGNEDWDHNNWIAARNRVRNDAGFRFFCWDAETSMTNVNYNNVDENNEENPSWFYHLLQGNADFKILFADHIQRNFFNGGALTTEAAISRYSKLADEIDLAIIAESARWGDYRKDVAPSDNSRFLYTRNDFWIPRKNELLNNYFPFRSDIVVQQFRDAGLFPNIKAPVFSHAGGEINSAIDLGMTTNYGEIYYTTDGTDPREQITSVIASQAKLFTDEILLLKDVIVKARAKSGNEWSPITVANFDFGNVTSVTEFAQNKSIQSGNYPNPFKESTQIFFTLQDQGNCQIDIISIDGRLVKILYSGFLSSGYQLIDWNSSDVKAGTYMFRINFNGQNYFGKMIKN